MGKSEISDNNKDYITDIARLNSQVKVREDLDYESDQSELILEKVKMVSKTKNTVHILRNNLFENMNNKFNFNTL